MSIPPAADRHVSEAELSLVAARIEQAISEVKKEVRWLLVLGLGLSQLFRNIDLPSTITATGTIIAILAYSGKVVASYFFVR